MNLIMSHAMIDHAANLLPFEWDTSTRSILFRVFLLCSHIGSVTMIMGHLDAMLDLLCSEEEKMNPGDPGTVVSVVHCLHYGALPGLTSIRDLVWS